MSGGGGGGGGGLVVEAGDGEGQLLRLRTARHTLKMSPRNSFGEPHSYKAFVRHKAVRELIALPALPVYPVFEDEKLNE